jgi:DNA-binding HxlR family transcriptional regulator
MEEMIKKKKKTTRFSPTKYLFLILGQLSQKKKKSSTLGAAIPCSNKFVDRN